MTIILKNNVTLCSKKIRYNLETLNNKRIINPFRLMKKKQESLSVFAFLITILLNAQPPYEGQSMSTSGISAKQILTDGHSVGDGIYWLDPDGAGGMPPFQAYCDMTTQGGGWTLGLKTWYQAGHYRNTGAVGNVGDALTLQGNPYKLSDQNIRGLIGASNSFDLMVTQTGFNSAYSTGNYEYAILNDYTGLWRWDQAMPASTTPTILRSYRASDGSIAWEGQIQFGIGGAGINGNILLSGTNPAGGSGCTINMGTTSNASWHHFFMANTNSDSYLYLCNGAQHSSGYPINHLYWFRSNEEQTLLGLNDVEETSLIYVYPNPTKDIIYIKGKDIILTEVISVLGEPLKQIKPSEENFQIDISDLSKGLYLIRVTSNQNIITKKIILK